MKNSKFRTLFILVISLFLVSCSNSGKNTNKKDEIPIDSIKLFYEDIKAKNLLFSDVIKTDFMKNYIENNYSKKLYDAILSNIRTDYQPYERESPWRGIIHVYSNGSSNDNISLKLEFDLGESPDDSQIYVDFQKMGCRVNKDGSLRTGNWEMHYLENDFDEELKEYPYIQTNLTYDKGYKDERLAVVFCKNGERLEFRLAGDITEYGSLKSYKILLKTSEYSSKEVNIDEKFGDCLVVYNDEGMQNLLNYFNKYDSEKKMVITYDDDWTGIYEKAVITNSSAGEDVYGAIYSHIFNLDINSI